MATRKSQPAASKAVRPMGGAAKRRRLADRVQRAVARHLANPPPIIKTRLTLEQCIAALLAQAAPVYGREPGTWQRLDRALELDLQAAVGCRAAADAMQIANAVRWRAATTKEVGDAFAAVVAADGRATALAVRAWWEQGRLADARHDAEREIVAEWWDRSRERLPAEAHREAGTRRARPKRQATARKNAKTNAARTAGKYDADYATILTGVVHDRRSIEEMVRECMALRKLTSVENYKKKVGIRTLKRQIADLTAPNRRRRSIVGAERSARPLKAI